MSHLSLVVQMRPRGSVELVRFGTGVASVSGSCASGAVMWEPPGTAEPITSAFSPEQERL